ncbi:MAG: DUF2474 family protein [Alphaproteobacteria bacterium]|nr:DUF2474 family protein [Alphaproteobacteria bacterium]
MITPTMQKIGWFIIIWAASIIALGIVAFTIRILISP